MRSPLDASFGIYGVKSKWVLVVGGFVTPDESGVGLASAELYDPRIGMEADRQPAQPPCRPHGDAVTRRPRPGPTPGHGGALGL